MANLPDLRSKEQIIGDIVDALLAKLGQGFDLNKGSVMSQLIEAMGQNVFRSSADVISMVDALSVDRAAGEALQRLANDKKVPIIPAQSATGKVNVTDVSFSKVSSIVYSGQPAPVAGTLKIYIADGTKFTQTGGKIYIGRGSTNVEGPLTYTSAQIEAGGAYWSITLASTSPTTKFHNIGESIILAQGGTRFVKSGAVIKTSQSASVTTVAFSTTADATIIDGKLPLQTFLLSVSRLELSVT